MLTLTYLERLLPKQAAPRVGQKPRHTLLGRALEAFRAGQSGLVSAALRRLTPTKHTAGPLGVMPRCEPYLSSVILQDYLIFQSGNAAKNIEDGCKKGGLKCKSF
jgi:hypothetical protein